MSANDTVDLFENLDQQNGNGGCLSSNIDPDGPYNIITNGVEHSEYFAAIINSSSESNVARFSFLTFDIGRTKMYVHTQLTLILQNGVRRRMQLLQTSQDGSNQIRHFIDSTTVISNNDILATNVIENEKESDAAFTFYVVPVFIISTFALVNV